MFTPSALPSLLLVEDNPHDLELAQVALDLSGVRCAVTVARGGRPARPGAAEHLWRGRRPRGLPGRRRAPGQPGSLDGLVALPRELGRRWLHLGESA